VAVTVVRPLLRTSWFALVLLALLGVLVSSDQAADVVRRWGLGQTLWSVLCVGLLAASIGLSRIYLRAHYWSDVAGGWALGGAIFGLCAVVSLIVFYMRDTAPARAEA